MESNAPDNLLSKIQGVLNQVTTYLFLDLFYLFIYFLQICLITSYCLILMIIQTPSFPRFLVGCFGFNGPLRQYFSLYRTVSQREGERRERIVESKNVQTTPTRTYCKCSRPLPYFNPSCRTPRHWKFTQHHRTTQPPPLFLEIIYLRKWECGQSFCI